MLRRRPFANGDLMIEPPCWILRQIFEDGECLFKLHGMSIDLSFRSTGKQIFSCYMSMRD